jgi:hypothetical protein
VLAMHAECDHMYINRAENGSNVSRVMTAMRIKQIRAALQLTRRSSSSDGYSSGRSVGRGITVLLTYQLIVVRDSLVSSLIEAAIWIETVVAGAAVSMAS